MQNMRVYTMGENNKDAVIEALKTIIAKSPAASKGALDLYDNANITDETAFYFQYNKIVEQAFGDAEAKLTDKDRLKIVNLMAKPQSKKKTEVLRVRINQYELWKLSKDAAQQGVTISEYVRKRLFS
jgi:predicted DNA binding CopG/RHH family protein